MRYLLKTFSLLLIHLAIYSAGLCQLTTDNQDVRVIKVEAYDQMKFNKTIIRATPGEKIKITLKTVSNLPKSAMAHNIAIIKPTTDVDAFINASAGQKENNYIAPGFKEKLIATTPLAGGGETVEVTFRAPEESGKYEYVCTFPGHYRAGMKGTLIIEESTSI